MRIQRQQDTFSWRFAAELPPQPEDRVRMPQGFPGTAQDWLERTAALDKMLEGFQKAGIDSRKWYGKQNPITGEYEYSPERVALHDKIIQNHFQPLLDAVPKGWESILMAGLGGSGKTTVLNRLGIITDPSTGLPMTHLALSADNNKEWMADEGMIPTVKWLAQQYPQLVPRKANGDLYDFTPLELSSLIQNESKDLTNRQALQAYQRGANVVWDYRMGTYDSALTHLANLTKNGYHKNGTILVDVSPNTSKNRGIKRHFDGMEQFYGRHMLSPADSSRLKSALRGGRRLPPFATKENFPQIPGSGELSSSAEAFKRLIQERPDLLTSGWLHINNEDFANPIIRSASGRWAGMQQLPPVGQPPTMTPPMPQPVPTRAALRRMFMAERDPLETDPQSVLGLLDAYRDGELEFPDLVEAIVQRYDQIKGIDRHPERAEWSQDDLADMMPDEDNGWWITAAVWSKVLTPEQAQFIKDEINSRVIL